MKVLDLFSGVGGFSYGLSKANLLGEHFETTLFCEVETFCHKVLTKNFPNIPIHNDIKTLKINDNKE